MAGTMPALAGNSMVSPTIDEIMGAIPSRKCPITGAFFIRCSISGFDVYVMIQAPQRPIYFYVARLLLKRNIALLF
jgi:hypothetical protein